MKYGEMVEFLNDNGIRVAQPLIALEVYAQLDVDITDEEFENVCEEVYEDYRGYLEISNVRDLVLEVLYSRGYKQGEIL